MKIDYVEHVLGVNHNGADNLIRRMEYDRPFRKPEIVEILLSNDSVGREKKHSNALCMVNFSTVDMINA